MALRRPAVHFFTKLQEYQKGFQPVCKNFPTVCVPVPETKGILPDESLKVLQEAEILVADPNVFASFDLLYKLPNLKWMQVDWAGVDALFKKVDSTQQYPKFTLTRFGGYFGIHMKEYVLGHIIAHERCFADMKEKQKNKEWHRDEGDFTKYRILPQLTLGIIGLGDIGKEVAKGAKALGMRVLGLVKSVDNGNKSEFVDQYKDFSDLDWVLSESDYICNILPSTSETKGFFTEKVLEHCQKKKSVFINVGRGDVISEECIINSLRKGYISHAILDVFNPEPLPESSQLWLHPQVTVTPHVAAVTFHWQFIELFEKNYEKYINGEEMDFVVNWEKGY